MNTRKQGDIGLGAAIAHFTSLGHSVSIPLTESQRYDLVADIDGVLHRVEVKTSTYMRNNTYEAMIKTCGGNQTGSGRITKFSSSNADLLYIWTPEGSYLIPASIICGRGNLKLGPKMQTYRCS